MKQQTVAIVINTSWNIYNFRLGLIRAFQEQGYRVVAIAPEDEYSEKLEALGVSHYDIKINNRGTNPVEDLKLIFDFCKLYKKISPDVILHYTIKPNIYGSLAAGMLGIPSISNISGLGTVFLNDSFSSKVARFLYKIALNMPQRVFYQNTYDRELFITAGLVKAEKTDLLPGSGIDTEKFKPEFVSKESNGTVRFLFIARLLKDKGLLEYVEAARNIRLTMDFGVFPEFAILGAYYPGNPTAVTEAEMKAWTNEGIVHYLGSTDDVKSVIGQYDCIVLPSYREGLSRVLLEAASMAKPIITTNVPGCKEVVDDGLNGFLCKVKDAASLAEQMVKMLQLSCEERIRMGEKGRKKIIEVFDEKHVVEKYLAAIRSILN